MYFDPLYLLIVGPGMLLALWATWKVKSTFNKYSRTSIASGMSNPLTTDHVVVIYLVAEGVSHAAVHAGQSCAFPHGPQQWRELLGLNGSLRPDGDNQVRLLHPVLIGEHVQGL